MNREELLQRLVGRAAPADHELRPAWKRLSRADQRRLRATATDPTAAQHLDDDRARMLVDALAAERIRRRTADLAVPAIVSLLVLSTVWGFGRAVMPHMAGWFLAAALVAALATTVVGWRRGAKDRAAARRVRSVLRRGAGAS